MACDLERSNQNVVLADIYICNVTWLDFSLVDVKHVVVCWNVSFFLSLQWNVCSHV